MCLIDGLRFRKSGPVGGVTHTRPVKQPIVTANQGLLSAIPKPCELCVLHPRSHAVPQPTGIFKFLFVRPQVRGSRALVEQLQRLYVPITAPFPHGLYDGRNGDHAQKSEYQESFRGS